MQVWFEAGQGAQGSPPNGVPAPIVMLHGVFTMSETLVWLGNDAAQALVVLNSGGRLFIRLHCWNLVDAQSRIFSAAPDALLPGVKTLHLPGGVLESWVFIAAG
jgi:hypothetical protein